MQHPGAEADAGEALVEELTGPGGEAGVDGPVEGEDALGHAAGRGDDDHHQDLRLEQQDLDVADDGGVDRRRRDDRQQVGDLRERLGGHAHRLVDLAADQLQAERALAGRDEGAAAELVDVPAVAGVGRHAARGGVRVREQPVLLEHRQLVADRRRAGLDLGVGRERLGAHGQAGLGVGLDDLAQEQLLAGREQFPPSLGGRQSTRSFGVAAAHDRRARLGRLGVDVRDAVLRPSGPSRSRRSPAPARPSRGSRR